MKGLMMGLCGAWYYFVITSAIRPMSTSPPTSGNANPRFHCYKCNRMLPLADMTQSMDASGRQRKICLRCRAFVQIGGNAAVGTC